MDKCIYDRMEECHHGCGSCRAYALKCRCCGKSDAPLYDIYGDIFCLDCLMECQGSELYSNFAEEYSDLFRDFCMRAWDGNCVS